MMKAYNFTPEYVLHEISYVNLIMYNAVLPGMHSNSRDNNGKGGKQQDIIRADDPGNRDKVRQYLNAIE